MEDQDVEDFHTLVMRWSGIWYGAAVQLAANVSQVFSGRCCRYRVSRFLFLLFHPISFIIEIPKKGLKCKWRSRELKRERERERERERARKLEFLFWIPQPAFCRRRGRSRTDLKFKFSRALILSTRTNVRNEWFESQRKYLVGKLSRIGSFRWPLWKRLRNSGCTILVGSVALFFSFPPSQVVSQLRKSNSLLKKRI